MFCAFSFSEIYLQEITDTPYHNRGYTEYITHSDISAERLAEYPEDTVFIVYCWSPGCNGATKAAVKISQLGRAVKEMIGGIEYWEDRERYPIERETHEQQ